MKVPTRLRAQVREATGRTRHYGPNGLLPTPAYVEIVKEPDGWFLYYFDETGNGITDTWHRSCEDAKHQAEFEFLIMEPDWEVLSD